MESSNLLYRKLTRFDAPEVKALIKFGQDNTRKDFLTAYKNQSENEIFNENNFLHYGAWNEENLAGILRLVINQNLLKFDKNLLKMTDEKICRLAGAITIPEFRNKEVMCNLFNMSFDKAKELECSHAIGRIHPENTVAIKAVANYFDGLAVTANNDSGLLRHFYIKSLDKGKSI